MRYELYIPLDDFLVPRKRNENMALLVEVKTQNKNSVITGVNRLSKYTSIQKNLVNKNTV